MAPPLYALIDCNNFFVSCERVFAPSLKHKPVAVLSSNDGCIISRSQEVKDLGIPMGAPVFEYKKELLVHDVVLFSSNFALYADMSHRVIETLRSFGLPIEVYSIDESFIHCHSHFDPKAVRERVLQWTGIPTAVGVAPTKTLAKVANSIAKKQGGYCLLTDKTVRDDYLAKTPVEDVWGVGRRIATRLRSYGITNALQLQRLDDTFIRKTFSVVLLKTVLELRGTSCLESDELPSAKKSITCSRSFGTPIYFLRDLKEAVATFTSRIGEKLRKQASIARLLIVYTSDASSQALLPYHTNDTRVLLDYAMQLTEELFREGTTYKKAGVLVCDIWSETSKQIDLFSEEKDQKILKLYDSINRKFGKGSLYFAAEGVEKRWQSKREKISKRFTTSWNELPIVR